MFKVIFLLTHTHLFYFDYLVFNLSNKSTKMLQKQERLFLKENKGFYL